MPDAAIQELIDRNGIYDVIVRYATAVDGRRWELMNDVFVPDAEVVFGTSTVTHGPDQTVERIRRTEDNIEVSQHLLGNFEIHVDGDTARSTCAFQAQHYKVNRAGGNTYLVGGNYHDELVRTPAGWRIKHRRIEPTWRDGNAALFG